MKLFERILVVFISISISLFVSPTEIQFDHVDFVNSTFLQDFYNFSMIRIGKYNRTTYVLNANAEFNNTAREDIKIKLRFHFNRLNNNQYTRMPMEVPKQTICQLGEKYYRPYLMNQVKNCSNFPQYKPGEPMCPILPVNESKF